MRSLTILALLAASPAAAHPGHIAEVAGHGHWIAAGALGLAALVGLLGARGKRKDDAADDAAETDAETAES
ncbi:hypothetical protein OG2516_09128 [Oceanicola granulosus HTCC2516]|uniref:Uncharacterized protein n=1 Tax=Oceanicola granulosus (strain ATCC BAA-861 / DSM 15982 / KCTC 12143 / HTCC2516) TaxID=314256 RepID=Q2CA96_OCEGH|nr:DUF6732 family protein [Oceanicola granulosus]EAR49588.1 hypothetical protein OG2516_09128 [Oceanicola granulosus HTCC2516]